MRLIPGNRTESNVQTNLTIRLRRLGFDVQQEVVPHGYPDTRFDNVILNRDGEITAVIECKNGKTHKQAKTIESKWWKSEQGVRYTKLSKQYDFQLFFCGGETEIQSTIDHILAVSSQSIDTGEKRNGQKISWWKRLFFGI